MIQLPRGRKPKKDNPVKVDEAATEAINNTSNRDTGGEITDRLVGLLYRGKEIIPPCLFNVFDKVTRDNFGGISQYRKRFLAAGARGVHLAGSGPALFTLEKDKKTANMIYQNLQKQGLESYWGDTLPAVELVK